MSADADILAGLAAVRRGEMPADPAPSAAADGAEDKPEPAEGEAAAEGEAEAEPDEGEEGDDDETEAEAGDEEPSDDDPETGRRLAMVQQAERRAREAVQAERAQLERERAQWETERKELSGRATRFDGLKDRLLTDPVSAMVDLGVPDDAFAYMAEQLYRLSPEAAKDPKQRDAARIAKLERDLAMQKRQAQEREEAARKEREEAAKKEEQQRGFESYAKSLTDAAAKSALLSKAGTDRDDVLYAAQRLYAKSGESPSPAAVVKELERQRVAVLKAHGVDVSELEAAKGKKKAKKTAAAPAAEKKPEPAEDKKEDPKPKTWDPEAERNAIIEEMRRAREEG